jgi:hypothetical protein
VGRASGVLSSSSGPRDGDGDVSYVEEPRELRATYSMYLARNQWADRSLPILQQRITVTGPRPRANFTRVSNPQLNPMWEARTSAPRSYP